MARFEEFRRRNPDAPRPELAPTLHVRPATSTDLPRVAALQAARDGGSPADHVAHLAQWVDTYVATDTGLLLLAMVGERLTGFAKVRLFRAPSDAPSHVAPDGYYLTGLVVDPEWRRRGLGHRLTQERLDWVRRRDRAAYYFANAQNAASIELHRAFGFVEVTRHFAFPGAVFEGGSGILFRAELGPGDQA